MGQLCHAQVDVPGLCGAQQLTVIILGEFAQAHGAEVETQEALFLPQACFDQAQQPAIGRLAVQSHVEQG